MISRCFMIRVTVSLAASIGIAAAVSGCSSILDVLGLGSSDDSVCRLEMQLPSSFVPEQVSGLDIAPDNGSVAVAVNAAIEPQSGGVVVVSLETGETLWSAPPQLGKMSSPPTGDVKLGDVRFSPAGDLLAVGSIGINSTHDGVAVWRTSDWELEAVLPHPAAGVAFTNDGSLLLTGGADWYFRAPFYGDTTVFAWETSSWEKAGAFVGQLPWPGDSRYWQGQSITSLYVSPDGTALCTGATSSFDTNIWSLVSMNAAPSASPFSYHVVGFGEAVDRIVAQTPSSGDDALSLIHTETGVVDWSLDPEGRTCAAMSHDGRWLVTGTNDGSISVFRSSDSTRVCRVIAGDNRVAAVTISHDNGVIVAVLGPALLRELAVLKPDLPDAE